MLAPTRSPCDQRSFLLQRAQPAMTGLIDGSLSTLAPIFAVALATHQPHDAFLAGLATAIGADVSMAFSEGLSDTGDLTGCGSPALRGAITGLGTFLGGVPAHAPAPHRRVPCRGAARAGGDGVRASDARENPPTVLRHRLPPLVHLHNARRGNHRHNQRRTGSSQLTARHAPARTAEPAPSRH
jgi:hypothetical protein